jgi:hypothetical protein
MCVKTVYGYGTVVPDKTVAVAVVAVTPVATTLAAPLDKAVAAAFVTIQPLKNAVEMLYILLMSMSVQLNKLAAKAFAVTKNVVYIISVLFLMAFAAILIKLAATIPV